MLVNALNAARNRGRQPAQQGAEKNHQRCAVPMDHRQAPMSTRPILIHYEIIHQPGEVASAGQCTTEEAVSISLNTHPGFLYSSGTN